MLPGLPHLRDVDIIGFDLDDTLYHKDASIDAIIQGEICRQVAELTSKPLHEVTEQWDATYPVVRSGGKTLDAMGVDPAKGKVIIQMALETPAVLDALQPDPELNAQLLELRKRGKKLSLITGSNTPLAYKKLARLGMSPTWFSPIIGGEVSKRDGYAFPRWIEEYHPDAPARRRLYIGDGFARDILPLLHLGIRPALVNSSDTVPAEYTYACVATGETYTGATPAVPSYPTLQALLADLLAS